MCLRKEEGRLMPQRLRLILCALILALVLGGCALVQTPAAPATPTAGATPEAEATPAAQSGMETQGATVVSPSALEERYGIQITMIAATAAGGLMDFRYKVKDVDKATQWLKDEKLMPTLINESNGAQLIPPAGMAHTAALQKDRVYYMLLPNTRNAIKPGDPISVIIGDLQLEPITAQ
jgi:hypothetical protein